MISAFRMGPGLAGRGRSLKRYRYWILDHHLDYYGYKKSGVLNLFDL